MAKLQELTLNHTLTVLAAALVLTACETTQASSPGVAAQSVDDLQAFPAAVAGQKRTVIRLPAAADEDALKVELILGRTQRVDCNHHSLGGQLQTRTAEGWGYDYYVLEAVGPGVSTLMGCPPGSERDAFVRAGGQTLIRYNSRLPLVVYAPQDIEVRYRLWRAGEERPAD